MNMKLCVIASARRVEPATRTKVKREEIEQRLSDCINTLVS